MKFVHGSSVDLEGKSFELFNYKFDINTQSADLDNIGSGLDAEGIGVYAFIGEREETINYAKSYVKGNETGYIYVLDVDVEEEDLLNNRDTYEISEDEWLVVIEDIMKEVRHAKGFDREKFEEIIFGLEENWDEGEKLNEKDLAQIFKTVGLKMDITEYQSQLEFEDFDDWRFSMEELYNMEEPYSMIYEAGGIEKTLEYALNKSDNLWESIKNIGEQFAVFSNGQYAESFNRVFHSRVMKHLGDRNLTAAFVSDERFAVIFDVDAIKIDKKIEFKKEPINTIDKENNMLENEMQKKITYLYNLGYEKGHLDTINDDYRDMNYYEKSVENVENFDESIDMVPELLNLYKSDEENAKKLTLIFNTGYMSGHHDTVESQYVEIDNSDLENYHKEEVLEIIDDLDLNVLDKKLDPKRPKRKIK